MVKYQITKILCINNKWNKIVNLFLKLYITSNAESSLIYYDLYTL